MVVIISVLAHVTQEKFDASLMHVMPEVAAQERMVDNGTGQVEVSTTLSSRIQAISVKLIQLQLGLWNINIFLKRIMK